MLGSPALGRQGPQHRNIRLQARVFGDPQPQHEDSLLHPEIPESRCYYWFVAVLRFERGYPRVRGTTRKKLKKLISWSLFAEAVTSFLIEGHGTAFLFGD